MCIDRYQNPGTQGPMLSAIVQNCDLQAGDKMMVHIEGGCGQFATAVNNNNKRKDGALRKRQAIQISNSNATLRNQNADGSLTYVAVDLGQLGGGQYNLQVSLGGLIDNLTVLDSNGDNYAR
jgi:hypothetical protein